MGDLTAPHRTDARPYARIVRHRLAPLAPESLVYRRAHAGFTLLELLVVMVIAGMLLGLAAFKAMPDDRQRLLQDAQRIALLLQVARDEAIVRNRPVAFEADARRYRFLIREEREWQVLTRDEMLRERAYALAPVSYTLNAATVPAPLRISFGHEPVDQPFLLDLAVAGTHVSIRADGVGHFTAE